MNLMVVISQVYKFVKTHQSVYLKWVDFSERNVYLNKVDLKKKSQGILLDKLGWLHEFIFFANIPH